MRINVVSDPAAIAVTSVTSPSTLWLLTGALFLLGRRRRG